VDFLIKSDRSATSLRFFNLEGENLNAEIISKLFSARIAFSTYPDPHGLLNVFLKMAQNWNGWNGKFSWESLERQFALSAETDALGHVSLHVSFVDNFGKEESWNLSATLVVFAGQLEKLSREAMAFFAENDWA